MPQRVPTAGVPGPDKRARDREYNRPRDRERDRLYQSATWKKVRAIKLGRTPFCERCFANDVLIDADHVHHKRSPPEYPEGTFDLDNLESLCKSCHSRLHMKERHDETSREAAEGTGLPP
jgi:5-methylcytosine-specific restriction protein A